MSRIILIHWNAIEAAERLEQLRRAGFDASLGTIEHGPSLLKSLRNDPPAAIVIDLSRMPSHGREVAIALRHQKSTRHVPIIFVADEPEKIEKVRLLLPDVPFTTWRSIAKPLHAAIENPPATPHVPDLRAGYSGTPLPRKLGLKPGMAVALLGAPKGFPETLSAMIAAGEFNDVRLSTRISKHTGIAVAFCTSHAQLVDRLAQIAKSLPAAAAVWFAWPKKASGVETDLSDNVVRDTVLVAGLVDFKVCAIDATWSGLCFKRRKA